MGWRERDWAKLEETERDTFYSRGTTRRYGRSGRGLLLALGVSIGLVIVLRQVPRRHPLIPVPAFRFRAAKTTHNAKIRTIAADYGSTYTLTGTTPDQRDGSVEATGSWNGEPWQFLASTSATAGRYTLRFRITGHGKLKLRVKFPGGEAAGSVLVP
jgi:hypothetical protein